MSLGWRFDWLVQILPVLSPAWARGWHQPASMTCGLFVSLDDQESFVMFVLHVPAIWMRSGPLGVRWMGASGVLEFHDQAPYLSQDELMLCRSCRYEFSLKNMNVLAGFSTAPCGCDGASCPMQSYFQHIRFWREGLVPESCDHISGNAQAATLDFGLADHAKFLPQFARTVQCQKLS